MKKLLVALAIAGIFITLIPCTPTLANDSIISMEMFVNDNESLGDKIERMVFVDGWVNPYTGYTTVKGQGWGLPQRVSYVGFAQAFPWVTVISPYPMANLTGQEGCCTPCCFGQCFPKAPEGCTQDCTGCWDLSFTIDYWGGSSILTPEAKAYFNK